MTTDREGNARGEMLRWGLVPSWADRPETGLKMINARVETVAERSAFRGAFERFRCLIIADGFYEWKAMPFGSKQPFHIARADGAPFAFAGLWSVWHGEDGNALRTCTILTTAPNAAVAPLHDRMPVILARDAEGPWLDTSTPRHQLIDLLEGIAASKIVVRPVSLAVNDARYDGPECLGPPVESAQATLF